MNLLETNGVKIFHVTAGKTFPHWISESRRKKLRDDPEFSKRLELIQDFAFPATASRLKVSADGQYLIGSGVYPPQIRCWELSQMSLKFKRHVDCEIVQFLILSDNFAKLALLRADRTIEFHAAFGTYYSTRVPKFGRDIAYHAPSCDLYVAGSTAEIYRLNLEQGRFLKPLDTSLEDGVNVAKFSPVHQLLACGGDGGIIEFFDPRVKSSVGRLDVGSSRELQSLLVEPSSTPHISALRHHDSDGLTLACGTASGHVLLYDLRAPRPMVVKDHGYGLPVVDIKFHTGRQLVLSADSKAVKLWDKSDARGRTYAAIEPAADINDVCVFGESGLVLLGLEQPRCAAYYVPSLGPAPRWCSYLENITEELEEASASGGLGRPAVYDDYKFVTREELEALGLARLVGTDYLRPYMHGFFIDHRLYTRVKALAEGPDQWEKYRKESVRKRLEAMAANRIAAAPNLRRLREGTATTVKLPKVNKELALALLRKEHARLRDESKGDEHDDEDVTTGQTKKNKKKKKKDRAEPVGTALSDPRFSAMFTNPDFEVDKDAWEYKFFHTMPDKSGSEVAGDDDIQLVEEDDEDEVEEVEEAKESETGAEEAQHSEQGKGTKKKVGFYELADDWAGLERKKEKRANMPEAALLENKNIPLAQRLELMSTLSESQRTAMPRKTIAAGNKEAVMDSSELVDTKSKQAAGKKRPRESGEGDRTRQPARGRPHKRSKVVATM